MPTFTAGQTLTAALLNLLADKPYARLEQTVSQNVNTSTDTAITFNAETFDSDGGHDNVTNNNRYTIQRAGKYFVAGTAVFAANATGIREAFLRVNGTTQTGTHGRVVGSAAITANVLCTPTILDVVVNDYIELACFQSSGGVLATSVSSNQKSTLNLYYLGT